ncbi:trna methyltransferase subunit protein [Lasallia pustulata]|uniref:tRNA (adenine(58)-N(1))-methyltransferase catalytic subunit TRM61 n=1 Tax=Lasallia pustulata TaxID=136370 RepID=A0A1W5CS01_9LECA|nr:trna methyltransferase subunit protein [Lasallia pustulata]
MAETQAFRPSPFLDPGPVAEADSLAVLHLRRDLQIPTLLREQDEQQEGYDEGKVTNTRFGSFPHSTLIGVPWGSQVRASAVDTGSRGRRGNGKASKGEKRKRDGDGLEEEAGAKRIKKEVKANENSTVTPDRPGMTPTPKAAVTASTGFIHILPPTPESWTTSLPHRTQVVYTPDYSYILHRLRARPGSVLIEAGAGSGSFTHAAARAVFNGYPSSPNATPSPRAPQQPSLGRVHSFEFHAQRHSHLLTELSMHGLSPLVHLHHRDVCASGFQPPSQPPLNATAIFLDLPAPWLALKHLTRSSPPNSKPHPPSPQPTTPSTTSPPEAEFRSPLNPHSAIHLCSFSPCIEQVQRTISTLRHLGWHSISTDEISAKRLETRRERIGLQEEGLRGVNPSAATVDEAVTRLREVEGRTKGFYADDGAAGVTGGGATGPAAGAMSGLSKQQRLEKIREGLAERKVWKEGRLVCRAELELKTHTSYLVFAVLPMEWTEEDEERARERWGMKKAAREREGGVEGAVMVEVEADVKGESDVKMEGNVKVEADVKME